MQTRTTRSTFFALALAALLLAWPETTLAIDTATRAAARDIATEGVEAYEAGDYPKAMERLERAYEVLQLPSLALWSARALEKNGQLVEASQRYLDATRLSTEGAGEQQVQLDAQAEAEAEREALRTRIPKVIVEIQGAPPQEVEVTINGTAVVRALYGAGLPSNPGDIEVVATWGPRTVKGAVILAEGEEKQITLNFNDGSTPLPVTAPGTAPQTTEGPQQEATPDPASPSSAQATPQDVAPPKGGSWQRTVGWIGVGVGGAGLVFGGVTGFLAIQRNQELASSCPGRVCGPDQKIDRWMYNNFRIMSSAGLIAGGVVAAAGVTLLVTAPKKQSSAFVSPYVALDSAGVKGAF